jgi:molecular chaperone DnaJ
MNLTEAYSILEIPSTATPEEAKKKYRELTKKYHPDVNKETGAEAKFKKINEAYQVVTGGKSSAPHPQGNPFDPFGGMRHRVRVHEIIELHATISFKDSVLGCKQDLKYNRKSKCPNCNGQGQYNLSNGCDKCGGRGQVVIRQGAMVAIQTCDKCFGRVQTESCAECKSDGTLDSEASITVTIPGGVQDSNILRLGGMGHYVGNMLGFDQHTDVHLHLHVTQVPGLRLEGSDVVTNLSLSLLEALRGCKKTVKTIMGDKDIDIVPQSKNKDEVTLPRLGVNKMGNQRVVLEVTYPKNIDSLIDFLDEEK